MQLNKLWKHHHDAMNVNGCHYSLVISFCFNNNHYVLQCCMYILLLYICLIVSNYYLLALSLLCSFNFHLFFRLFLHPFFAHSFIHSFIHFQVCIMSYDNLDDFYMPTVVSECCNFLLYYLHTRLTHVFNITCNEVTRTPIYI